MNENKYCLVRALLTGSTLQRSQIKKIVDDDCCFSIAILAQVAVMVDEVSDAASLFGSFGSEDDIAGEPAPAGELAHAGSEDDIVGDPVARGNT